MPLRSDGSCHASEYGLTVTTRALAGADRRVQVSLAGDIDMDASAVLSETIDWLTTLNPASVLVDLAAVTFACATLPNFVARIRDAVPDGAEVILSGARPATKWVLRATNMAAIATIHDRPTEPHAVRVQSTPARSADPHSNAP